MNLLLSPLLHTVSHFWCVFSQSVWENKAFPPLFLHSWQCLVTIESAHVSCKLYIDTGADSFKWPWNEEAQEAYLVFHVRIHHVQSVMTEAKGLTCRRHDTWTLDVIKWVCVGSNIHVDISYYNTDASRERRLAIGCLYLFEDVVFRVSRVLWKNRTLNDICYFFFVAVVCKLVFLCLSLTHTHTLSLSLPLSLPLFLPSLLSHIHTPTHPYAHLIHPPLAVQRKLS